MRKNYSKVVRVVMEINVEEKKGRGSSKK